MNGSDAPRLTEENIGRIDGAAVTRFTLDSGHGLRVAILSYGGIVQSLTFPDRDGRTANVVLGFADLDAYVAAHDVYFGALIGRYANRIARGRFSVDDSTLGGTTHQVTVNDNGNSLHGGTVGFDHHLWTPVNAVSTDNAAHLSLRHISPDGDQGYPGTLTTHADYTVDTDNRLTLTLTATTDAPTVLNLTNHTYWNLAGESSGPVTDHVLWLNAHHYTPVTSDQIPTGAIAPVADTPFDFTTPTPIGARLTADHDQLRIGSGYDLNWVLDPAPSTTAAPATPAPAARVTDPASGRTLTVATTQPGLQFYSGGHLDGTHTGPTGHPYTPTSGFALETQHFPDSPNHPAFPSTVLRPGEVFREVTVFGLSTG